MCASQSISSYTEYGKNVILYGLYVLELFSIIPCSTREKSLRCEAISKISKP